MTPYQVRGRLCFGSNLLNHLGKSPKRATASLHEVQVGQIIEAHQIKKPHRFRRGFFIYKASKPVPITSDLPACGLSRMASSSISVTKGMTPYQVRGRLCFGSNLLNHLGKSPKRATASLHEVQVGQIIEAHQIKKPHRFRRGCCIYKASDDDLLSHG